MTERVALRAVVVGTALIALAFAAAWNATAMAWATWCMIAGCGAVISGSVLLGALRSRVRRGPALAAALFLLVIVVGGFGLPLLLPPDRAAGRFVLGLPPRVAIEIYGVGLLPILVLPMLFAVAFRADALDPASLDRLRQRAAALRGGEPPVETER